MACLFLIPLGCLFATNCHCNRIEAEFSSIPACVTALLMLTLVFGFKLHFGLKYNLMKLRIFAWALTVKTYILKQYRGEPKRCEFCNEVLKIGDRIVRTSTGKVYHEKCFRKLLH